MNVRPLPVALETQQPDETLRHLERARALERFVQNRRANPRNVEEARRLLASLA
ncbi:hypothetical protein LXT12_25665 [Pelomonas sp. P7]|uniref:Uncharacterized protein n=1 Tax=Pelomonas caseinilytica TaxID=2906763 RepID=A0ABS8XPR3_9BURK|nr:hypothetical protein [Pelomonas sp. P7]MCE4540629.1 hypothetical protein [Pelomonas sp. P7]